MLCQLPQCLCRPVPAEPHAAVSFLLEQCGGICDSGWVTANCPQPLSVAMPPQLDQGAGPGLCLWQPGVVFEERSVSGRLELRHLTSLLHPFFMIHIY